MTKYFCDVCGVERGKTSAIRIPTKNIGNGSCIVKDVDACSACKKEYYKINDMLADHKIEVFANFMKSKGE